MIHRYLPPLCCLGLAAGLLRTFAASAAAPSPSRPEPVPELHVDTTDRDAGVVEPGERVGFTFKIRNTGKAPLKIESVTPSCGCVVSEFDHAIRPGTEGSVRMTLDTLKLYGFLGKNVTVTTNDPTKRQIVLTGWVKVRRAIEVLPGDNLLMPLAPPKTTSRELTLRSHEGPLRISHIDVDSPHIMIEEIPPAKGEGEETNPDTERVYRVSVLGTAPAAGFEGIVSFHTESPRRRRIDVRVVGQAVGIMSISPPRLYFGSVKPIMKPPVQRIVSLTQEWKTFRVTGVQCSDPHLQAAFRQSEVATWEILLTYAAGWSPGPVKGTVVVETDDPDLPRVEIPFQADVSK